MNSSPNNQIERDASPATLRVPARASHLKRWAAKTVTLNIFYLDDCANAPESDFPVRDQTRFSTGAMTTGDSYGA